MGRGYNNGKSLEQWDEAIILAILLNNVTWIW